MSERDKKFWHDLKADPKRYAAYLDKKRRERAARPGYEAKRKAKWRAANQKLALQIRRASHAVESAVKGRKLYKRKSCQECGMSRRTTI